MVKLNASKSSDSDDDSLPITDNVSESLPLTVGKTVPKESYILGGH